MGDDDKRTRRYLDDLDRRSPVSLSSAARARDISRPSQAELDRALERLTKQTSEAKAEAPPTSHSG
jgi:hypothetical protein